MTEGFIELCETFNTKGCPEELIFGGFYNQPLPSTYSDLINDYYDNVTPIEASLAYNKGVENSVIPHDEDINEKNNH